MEPRLCAGVMFLLTWALLGVMALGVIYRRGRRREVWLGATLFGAGYMIAAFGSPSYQRPWRNLPTNRLLTAVQARFPALTDDAAGATVLKQLEQPVPMHFYEETPLEDVLKHIIAGTRTADGKGLRIYVDPIGLQEAEKSMTSTVRNMDLEGIPLRTTLSLILAQLDLVYIVRDGVVLVTSAESADDLPVYEDSFVMVGHCLLALVGAGLGGFAAALVAGRGRKNAGQPVPG